MNTHPMNVVEALLDAYGVDICDVSEFRMRAGGPLQIEVQKRDVNGDPILLDPDLPRSRETEWRELEYVPKNKEENA